MQTSVALLRTELPNATLLNRGKVRDIYEVENHLLLVTTDRISAYDCVLPNGIPDKGAVLTQLSRFWFEHMGDVVRNHLVSIDVAEFPGDLPAHADQLAGRSMLCRRADRFDVECVVRGYLIGSGWRDYERTGAVCGIDLPAGLRMADRLPEPLFTPSTKADTGHDENIDIDEMARIVGPDWAKKLAEVSIDLYTRAATHALEHGIIIADTKFEFGLVDGELTLIDEVLTPDSSRFWPVSEYAPGQSPPSFDKQFVRDYLSGLDWDKTPPAPELPQEVVERTSEKYREAYERLVGQPLPTFGTAD